MKDCMILPFLGDTVSGGDPMAEHDIEMGGVVYHIAPVFMGAKSRREILLGHILHHIEEECAFDDVDLPMV